MLPFPGMFEKYWSVGDSLLIGRPYKYCSCWVLLLGLGGDESWPPEQELSSCFGWNASEIPDDSNSLASSSGDGKTAAELSSTNRSSVSLNRMALE